MGTLRFRGHTTNSRQTTPVQSDRHATTELESVSDSSWPSSLSDSWRNRIVITNSSLSFSLSVRDGVQYCHCGHLQLGGEGRIGGGGGEGNISRASANITQKHY